MKRRRNRRRGRVQGDRRRDAAELLRRGTRDESDHATRAQRCQEIATERPRIGQPARRCHRRGARAPGVAVLRMLGAQRDRAQGHVRRGGQGRGLADGAALDDAAEQPARSLHVEHRIDHQRRAAAPVRRDGEREPPGREVPLEELDGDAVGPVVQRHPPRQVEERDLQLPVDDRGATVRAFELGFDQRRDQRAVVRGIEQHVLDRSGRGGHAGGAPGAGRVRRARLRDHQEVGGPIGR